MTILFFGLFLADFYSRPYRHPPIRRGTTITRGAALIGFPIFNFFPEAQPVDCHCQQP
jgi:hypothetical protein